ncbi:protein kinase [Myxococcus sp. K38C18041901]|uniref:serine/threonine-protein kinase n=1 Tax=Myxococcus guangdongensis TaxID=2906760 RepID=UPI0020A73035|nr:serine/threonine-protein kinase [Myxococcus guangdongensis]MCP3062366.1 protein kinase [Myxococcus guangdongensis]
MTLLAGTQIGKYVVRRKLAEGGMAEIYLCTARGAEGFEKEVVIKRVRAFLASDPEFVGMFIAEARLASRLNHANVVQIFDFDKHEDTYYLAMEYVRGCSLWELRRKSKELMEPMPPMLVAQIGAEVARGLHYAHRLKVNGHPLDLVHRDVTPHNVLLSYDGAVKLTDFGIAKAGKKLTQPGMLKGKFAYMSPEQSRGEDVDSRTDLFALGVVLWEMLTGGRLFDGDSELAVLRAVQQSVIPPPARLNPEVPAELDAVVMRALERDPAARFQTAGELERALAQCVLRHARSVDDTDLAGFLRRLFPTTPTMALPAVQERTQVLPGEQVPEGDDEDVAPLAPSRREPTAVMRPGRAGGGAPSSPDEDFDASTFVLPRRDEAEMEAPRVPLPPMATPMMPLPAVASSPVPRRLTPPVAAPLVSVRPSRPEGTSSVALPIGAVPARTPSRPGDVAAVARRDSSATRDDEVSERSADESEGAAPSWPGLQGAPAPVGDGALDRGHSGAWAQRDASQGRARSSTDGPATGVSAAAVLDARAGGPQSLSGSEVPTVTDSSPGSAATSKWRRPRTWALVGGLGLSLFVSAVVVTRERWSPVPGGAEAPPVSPVTTPPEAVAARAPAPSEFSARGGTGPTPAAPNAEAGTGDSASPAAEPSSDSEAEVEGMKREEALAAGPTPSKGASVPEPSSQAAVSTGTLLVRATPYATVYLDGRKLGEVSGRATFKVAPGTYKLLFHHPAGEKLFVVTLTAGSTVTREFRPPRGR